MMKNLKKLLSLVLSVTALGGAVGCGGVGSGSGETNKIWIAFAECGYGRTFLETWIEEFKAAYPEENWEFELEGDPDITGEIQTRLSENNEVADIFMGLDTNWQTWAARGWLEPLDSVYSSYAYDDVTVEEFMNPEARVFGKVNNRYYAIPWSDSTNGFVYNEKMFDQYGWEVPNTVQELYELCDKINALDANKDSDKGNNIAPFVWGGQVSAYWDFAVQNWWAQYEGAEAYTEFFKYENANVYKQEGRLKALEVFENLIVDFDSDDGVPKNSAAGSLGFNHIESQQAFLQGKAAMMPMGAWMETEMERVLPDDFEMRMMPIPFIDGAKTDADGNPIRVNASSAGDFMVIPKNAANKEGAIKFMQFINTREMIYSFTKDAQTVRPFQYKTTEIEGLQVSEFTKSCFEIYDNSTTLYQFSENPLFWNVLVGKWPGIGAPYNRMVVDGETAKAMVDECYNHASSNWQAFLDQIK